MTVVTRLSHMSPEDRALSIVLLKFIAFELLLLAVLGAIVIGERLDRAPSTPPAPATVTTTTVPVGPAHIRA